jgi:hypothetical protein
MLVGSRFCVVEMVEGAAQATPPDHLGEELIGQGYAQL